MILPRDSVHSGNHIEVPQPMRFMRLTLTAKNRKGVKVTMFVPVCDGFKFAPEALSGVWPSVSAHWDGPVWGDVDWDEEQVLLVVRWSDGDITTADFRPGLELYAGRLLTFRSKKHGTDDELVVETAELV